MDYVPERMYVKLERRTALLLAKLAKGQQGELRDPRKLGALLLSEAIEMKAAGKAYVIPIHNHANDDDVEPSQPQPPQETA